MLLHSLLLAVASVVPSEGPFRDFTFAEALAKAGEENKIVFVDFFTTWCGPCKMLDKTTWKDERVVTWLGEKTIALKIDAEHRVDLARDFQIRAYPSLVFIRPDRSEIGRLTGYRNAEDFLQDAQDVLAGRKPSSTDDRDDVVRAVAKARAALEGHENDPILRNYLADALLEADLYEEALIQYLWCWDEGLKHDSAYVGVRGSFMLGDLRVLARDHHPAVEAMKIRRAALELVLLDEESDENEVWRAASDIELLDTRFFIEPGVTLALHDKLTASHGAQDRRVIALRMNLISQLVGKRRYEEVLQLPIDYTKRFQRSISLARVRLKNRRIPEEYAALVDPDAERSHVVKRGFRYFEAYAGAGRDEDALKIADIAIEFHGHADTFIGLLRSARRAESQSAWAAVLAQARMALESEELSKVEKAGAWIQ